MVRGARVEAEEPSQQLAKQESWRSPQSNEEACGDEDMNGVGEV